MCKNIGKSVSKNVSGKYSQKLIDHDKQSSTNAHIKLLLKNNSKNSRINSKTAEATGHLIKLQAQ